MAAVIQVVTLDNRDYILRYKDFSYREVDKLLEYIENQIKHSEGSKINIRKW